MKNFVCDITDWLEFSPYEIGIAKYAAFMKTEDFGCKYFKGRIVKRFPESPLHYLQGFINKFYLAINRINLVVAQSWL